MHCTKFLGNGTEMAVDECFPKMWPDVAYMHPMTFYTTIVI
jgi:hypothetical protein